VEFQSLIYQTGDGRAVLTLHRPQRRNALSPELVGELLVALKAARDDDDVRVVILTGSGDKAFCAGGDLARGMLQPGVLPAHWARAGFGELLTLLRDLGKPSIAKVQGEALGGGFGLALACDLVVAAEEARFGTPEIRLGLFPHVILSVLQRNVPRKALLEMVLTGDKVSASEGHRLGFVNRLAPRAELDAATDALAAAVGRHSPAILRLGRESFFTLAELDFDRAVTHASALLSLNTLAEDTAEGVSAFLSKRPPEWKGR
jgi:enoyl-CoA hydratase